MKINANNGKQLFQSYGLISGGSISKIVVNGDGKIICRIDSGKIEPKQIKTNKFGRDEVGTEYGFSIDEITLTGEVKKANKENLNRKDNYILKYVSKYHFSNVLTYAIYIHVSECSVIDLGEQVAMQTADETCYIPTYKLQFKNPVKVEKAVYNRLPYSDDWKIPNGCRFGDGVGRKESPVYSVFDPGERTASITGKKLEKCILEKYFDYEMSTDPIIVTVGPYTRFEYSEQRINDDKLAKVISDAIGHRLSHYDIEKLRKVCNITIKA